MDTEEIKKLKKLAIDLDSDVSRLVRFGVQLVLQRYGVFSKEELKILGKMERQVREFAEGKTLIPPPLNELRKIYANKEDK